MTTATELRETEAHLRGVTKICNEMVQTLYALKSDTQKALDACDKMSGADRLGIHLSRMMETIEAALAKAEGR